MTTFAALVAYDGTRLSGFQRQAADKGPTAQGALEAALERVAGEPIALVAAGRTDSGVHATGQVVSFQATTRLDANAWQRALNASLPSDIAVRAVRVVNDDFHARRSALGRQYRYRIVCDPVRDPLRERYCWRVAHRLDVEAMAQAAALLLGEHDFAAFGSSPWDRTAEGYQASTVRTVTLARCAWLPATPDMETGEVSQPDEIALDFAANAFLTRMVRRMVGTLALVGAGTLSPEDVRTILLARAKAHLGAAAPPQGLCLTQVVYPTAMLTW